MIIRKYCALLFVAMLCSQLASNANDLDKLLNTGLRAGKKEAVRTFTRTVQKRAQNTATAAAAATKTVTPVTVTAKGTDAKVETSASTATTVSAMPAKKTTSSKIKEKVAAEVERNAMRYGNKYLKKGQSQLTNFLK